MKCYIEHKCWQKMQYYIQNIDAEISGWGKTEIIGEDIYVKNIVIFKQTVTGSTTELDQDARAKFSMELKRIGEKSEDWNLWWHSHSTMSTFWSGTDEKAIENEVGCIPYLLSIVSNKAKSILTRLDVTMNSSIPLEVGYMQNTIDKIVTEIVPAPATEEQLTEFNTISGVIQKAKEQIEAWTFDLTEGENKMKKLMDVVEEDKELEKECIADIAELVSKKDYNTKKDYQWLGKKNGVKIKTIYDHSGYPIDPNMYPLDDDDDFFCTGKSFKQLSSPDDKPLDKYIEEQYYTMTPEEIKEEEDYINENFKTRRLFLEDNK